MTGVQSQPISLGLVLEQTQSNSAGGMAIFLGTVRDRTDGKPVSHLVYEAYTDMALKSFDAIMAQARERWELEALSVVHRVGRLDIGETAVMVVATAAHRAAAFEAARYVIDTVKTRSPIWKKEVFRDGTSWWSEGCSSEEHHHQEEKATRQN